MSEQVVKYESRAIEAYQDNDDILGAELLEREDVIIPRVKIQQPTSQFGDPANVGKLYNNISQRSVDQIRGALLRVHISRVMWPDEFSGDNDPLCASDDGRVPREDERLSEPQAGPCATCEFAKWGPNKEPPRCAKVYTYMFADMDDDDMPFLLSAMRTSAGAAKAMNTLIKSKSAKRHVTIISHTPVVRGEKGQWYELTFATGEPLDREQVRFYATMASSLAGVQISIETEEDFIDHDADAGEDDELGF